MKKTIAFVLTVFSLGSQASINPDSITVEGKVISRSESKVQVLVQKRKMVVHKRQILSPSFAAGDKVRIALFKK